MNAMTPVLALYHHADSNPHKPAFIAGEDSWSYRRMAAGVDRLARAMTARGVRPGDRVVLHMTNRPELVLAYFACFRIGAIAAPLGVRLKASELRPLLVRLRPSLYIGDQGLYPRVSTVDSEILPANARFVVGQPAQDDARHWDDLLRKRDGGTVPDFPDIHAPAVLLPTSGATGVPKLVAHTPLSLNACVDASLRMGLGDHDPIILVCTSMLHAAGFQTLMLSVRSGATAIVLERFDAREALHAIERHRCTWMMGLPFMYSDILRSQRAQPRKVDSLRFCLSSGEVCPLEVQHDFERVFGLPLRSVWASTEVVGTLLHGLRPGAVSRCGSRSQVLLLGEHGEQVRHGHTGELCIRGPNVTIGYWKHPGNIESACVDGWFRTGDLMRRGEGEDIWFVARRNDLITRAGSNIAPLEIERILLAHPAVLDAAVVGIPDTTLGERVGAAVRLVGSGSQAVVDDILASARAHLADYKVPDSVHIVDEIPRNALGKIDRSSLRALF
jgi:acyl-CoA synthetase (AMP-forming)/AMP-acid ligase II